MTKPENTRPLSSLISHFNNQRFTNSKPIIPTVKDVSLTNNNSFSEKSVKAFVQESKLLNKAEKQPKSFRLESTKKTDLSEAFSRLVLSRKSADPKPKAENPTEVIYKRLVNLKPVLKAVNPQAENELLPFHASEIPQNNLKKMTQIFQSSNMPNNYLKSDASAQDDGFVSFSNNCLTNNFNDLDDEINDFKEFSASCLSLTYSSILPQSEYSLQPESYANDLLTTELNEEEIEIDKTLSDSLVSELLIEESGEKETLSIEINYGNNIEEKLFTQKYADEVVYTKG